MHLANAASGGRSERGSFLPCMIRSLARPERVRGSDCSEATKPTTRLRFSAGHCVRRVPRPRAIALSSQTLISKRKPMERKPE